MDCCLPREKIVLYGKYQYAVHSRRSFLFPRLRIAVTRIFLTVKFLSSSCRCVVHIKRISAYMLSYLAPFEEQQKNNNYLGPAKTSGELTARALGCLDDFAFHTAWSRLHSLTGKGPAGVLVQASNYKEPSQGRTNEPFGNWNDSVTLSLSNTLLFHSPKFPEKP